MIARECKQYLSFVLFSSTCQSLLDILLYRGKGSPMLKCVYMTLFHCGNNYCGFHVHFLLERKCGLSLGICQP